MREDRARSAHRTFLAVALVACVLGIASATSAFAQDEGTTPGDDDQVVLTGQLLVPEGATVGTAVIFNGNATIDGTATESVVAFNGDVEITGTVGDDVVAFNGRVIVRSGAEVDGDIASRQGPADRGGRDGRGRDRGDLGPVRPRGARLGRTLRMVVRLHGLDPHPRARAPPVPPRRRRSARRRVPPAYGRLVRVRRGDLLPPADRRGAAARRGGRDPAGRVPAARARPAVHGRLRRGRARARKAAGEAAGLAVRGLPRRVADPSRDRVDPVPRWPGLGAGLDRRSRCARDRRSRVEAGAIQARAGASDPRAAAAAV